MVALALLCFGVAQTLGGSGFIAAFVGSLAAGKHLPGQDTMAATVAWTIMLSVLAHGLTANPLAKAFAARPGIRHTGGAVGMSFPPASW